MKKIVHALKGKRFWTAVNVMALSVVILNAQQCCYWFMHQPEFPESADKYRKFK